MENEEYPKNWIDKMIFAMVDDEFFENEFVINHLLNENIGKPGQVLECDGDGNIKWVDDKRTWKERLRDLDGK